MDAQGTCIVSQATIEANLVAPRLLESAGFRVKQVAASSAADIIMSKAGTTAGFFLFSAAAFKGQDSISIDTR